MSSPEYKKGMKVKLQGEILSIFPDLVDQECEITGNLNPELYVLKCLHKNKLGFYAYEHELRSITFFSEDDYDFS